MKNSLQNLTSVSQKASNFLLLFLLLVRLDDQYIMGRLFGSNFPSWYGYLFVGLVYFLTIVLIWLNRTSLEKMNVDKIFIYLAMAGGGIFLIYLPSILGLLSLLGLGLMFWALKNNLFIFEENRSSYPLEIWPLALISIGTALAPFIYYKDITTTSLNFQIVIAAVLDSDLALIVVEEVLFRGALWAYLRKLGLSEKNIILVQASLFWISHHRFLLRSNPYMFWFSVPLNSLIFGVMVWRSKSITPSTISHFLYNVINILFIKAMI